MRVQHRHIIYMQGYDPRGLAQYYRMFRTELRKFGRLYQLTATISRPQARPTARSRPGPSRPRRTTGRPAPAYDFLRFEDFIQRDLAAPIWRTVLQAVWIYWRLVFAGTIARFWRANWRFATFITYPHFLLLLEAIGAAGLAFGFAKGLDALGIPDLFSIAAATAVFVAVLGTVLKYTENQTYLLYLLSDTIWTWEFSHRAAPGMGPAHRPLRAASGQDRARAATPRRSSSSATVRDRSWAPRCWRARCSSIPTLGRHGPRIVLLTIGGNFPIVGFHAVSQQFRDHLRMLAVEPSIDWIDCQSRKDVMNFYPFDPIAGHGIDVGAARRNPTIVPVRFRDIIKPEHYNVFRWKFFRVHFQFVMANERPHAYDFFMIVCGPVPLSERMAVPDAALAVATGDPAAREWAWKRIETAKTDAVRCRRIERDWNLPPAAAAKKRRYFSCLRRPGTAACSAGWLWRPLWCKACSSMG